MTFKLSLLLALVGFYFFKRKSQSSLQEISLYKDEDAGKSSIWNPNLKNSSLISLEEQMKIENANQIAREI